MANPKAQKIFDDYKFHNLIINRFVGGISHEESVLGLPFEHNCMNWILGHIVTNRSHVLETVGAMHSWQKEVRELYQTDTPPVTPESPSIHFKTLITYLNESVDLLENSLENVTHEWLDEKHNNYRGEKTRYEHIIGFHWHESFHLGQLEILKAYIHSKRKDDSLKERFAMSEIQDASDELIALESAALERWGNGDPSGFLEICAPDVVYFDPYQEMRIDGLDALTQVYNSIWGQVYFDRFELLNPRVQVEGKMAVLTFNYISNTGDRTTRWNCTEVYRHNVIGWRIIQTHWSYTCHPAIVNS